MRSTCLRVTGPTALSYIRDATHPSFHDDPEADASCDNRVHFTFDAVLPETSTQLQVYDSTARPVLHKFLQGFNGCVFAYGQTSSGKTHTMQGTAEQPGIMPQICKELFESLGAMGDKYEYSTKVTYLEIYQEVLRDLLAADGEPAIRQLRESPKLGIIADGARKADVRTLEEVYNLLARGDERRVKGETKLNAASSRWVETLPLSFNAASMKPGVLLLIFLLTHSVRRLHAASTLDGMVHFRSHAVLTLFLKQQERDDPEGLTKKTSKLHLIDLAGSERSGAAETVRRKSLGLVLVVYPWRWLSAKRMETPPHHYHSQHPLVWPPTASSLSFPHARRLANGCERERISTSL